MSAIPPEKVKALQELLSSPGMPVFMLRNKGINFVVKPEMVEEKYQDKVEAIEQKMMDESQENEELKEVILVSVDYPDLKFANSLSKSADTFSLFKLSHQRIAGALIEIFLKAPTIDELLTLGVYCRERLNAYLFIYAWTSALTHRKDTRRILLPGITENLPAKFFPKVVTNDSRKVVYMSQLDRPIVKLRTETAVSNISDEIRMNYFREDIAVNQHHYHWHIVYPYQGPMEIVNKDRRGELFVYMHNQILRRMDIDRFCLGIPAVIPLLFHDGAIVPDGYFPKMDTSLGSMYNAGRPDGAKLREIQLDGEDVTAEQIRLWLERLTNSIKAGYIIVPDKQPIKLDIETGIDVIGNVIEACMLSPNQGYYGSAHNLGHTLIANCHDPSRNNKEAPGVMHDVTTAMRDPIFYRWHKMLDEVCREYKITLPFYTKDELSCDDVSVDKIEVLKDNQKVDTLTTFWEWNDVNCSRGLDFKSSTPVYIRFKILNHEEWETKITVTNKSPVSVKVSVRIWFIPVHDFMRYNINLARQRNLGLEMDKYVTTLEPGKNTLSRNSKDSTVTIPFERAFPSAFGDGPPPDATDETAYCMCGWPHHMLLPIGTMDGAPFEVFVMLTPFEKDRVETDDIGAAYCGIRNKKYPDKRAMGFPFDRLFDTSYEKLDDLCHEYPNMNTTRIKIEHRNEERKGKYLLGEL